MSLILVDTQLVRFTISGADAANQPAPVEGVTVISSNPDVLTVEPDTVVVGGFIAVTTGLLGTAQLQATADARVGEGESLITGLLDVEVVPGEAVQLAINAGVPESRL